MICTDQGMPLSEGAHFLKKAGGAPANVAAAVAALGGAADLVAKVGVDPFGQHLVDLLTIMGVDTRFVFRDPAHFTTFAFVSLLAGGERDFYFNRGADGQLSADDLAALPLHEFSIVHFGSATAFLPGPLQTAYLHLLQAARQGGLFVSFDPNYRELLFGQNKDAFVEQSWHFLTACDFFKLSEEEALLLTGTDTPEQAARLLLDRTTAVFAITLGAAGTLLGYKGHTCHVESISVNPVDSTGAGDAFVGAVLYQLLLMTPDQRAAMDAAAWQKTVRNGNKAGARTCEYLGAMEAFRHLHRDIFE